MNSYVKPIPEEKQFFMTYRGQLRLAGWRIATLPSAHIAYRIFIEALCALHQDKGVIRLERKQLARDLGIDIEEVEAAMALLAGQDIFYRADEGWREFDKLCLNPFIAWKGSLPAREQRKKLVRPLTEPPLASPQISITLTSAQLRLD